MNIFIDFDNTIVNSIEAFCSAYNFLYDENANWSKVRKWNMTDECPLSDRDMTVRIFEDGLFFQKLKFYDNKIYHILKRLSKTDNIFIVSVGSRKNLLYKKKWVLYNLPFINEKNIILLSHFNDDSNVLGTIDKSEVNMENGILIDDNQDALLSSNAKYKLLYSHNGIKAEWNKNVYYDYPVVSNVDVLEQTILDIKKNPTN